MEKGTSVGKSNKKSEKGELVKQKGRRHHGVVARRGNITKEGGFEYPGVSTRSPRGRGRHLKTKTVTRKCQRAGGKVPQKKEVNGEKARSGIPKQRDEQ